MQKIKIYAASKGKQLILFVNMFQNLPYIAEASDIHRDIDFADKSHPIFDTLKKLPDRLPDDATHLALLYNGLGWEISGLANKEKENSVTYANGGKRKLI